MVPFKNNVKIKIEKSFPIESMGGWLKKGGIKNRVNLLDIPRACTIKIGTITTH